MIMNDLNFYSARLGSGNPNAPLLKVHSMKPIFRFLWLILILLNAGFVRAGALPGYIMVLGTSQDGGYPHIGCKKECCSKARGGITAPQNVVSLALVDEKTGQWWLFEATPDISAQLHMFDSLTNHRFPFLPSGIFITHAHTGHYTGLMELGREAMNARSVPVYVLPRMAEYLKTNGPWSQLVALSNIEIREMQPDSAVVVAPGFEVLAKIVPHRDEYSETCGFMIHAVEKQYLFIPDIDKWDRWTENIVDAVAKTDVAFLDGTFSEASELPGRNMKEIPHPFISETLELFADMEIRKKICFIHFNHSNRVMWDDAARKSVQDRNARVAQQWAWY